MDQEGNPWFVAKDVCEILGIWWSGSATLKNIPQEWKLVVSVTTTFGSKPTLCLSESGVYKLTFRSDKPEADRFTNWLAGEVVPQIRKTGTYSATPQLPQDFEEALVALLDQVRDNKVLVAKITEMEPKADFYDDVMEKGKDHTVSEAAKLLKIDRFGRNKLYEWLVNRGYLMYLGKRGYEPYQSYINQKYFKVIENRFWNPYLGMYDYKVKVLITPKGLAYIHRKLQEEGYISRAA